VVICLERGADLHMAQLMPLPLTISCSSKIQIGFTCLVPAHLGSPGQRAIKQVCVCVCNINRISDVAHYNNDYRHCYDKLLSAAAAADCGATSYITLQHSYKQLCQTYSDGCGIRVTLRVAQQIWLTCLFSVQ